MSTLAGPSQKHVFLKFILMLLMVLITSVVSAAPGLIGFQAHIYKPDNTPLQAAAVNFRFTITDPVGTCVIYSEDFTNQNMSNSSGVVALSIGGGAKSYPAGPLTMYEVFNNLGQAFTCQSGGTYNSGSAERRRLIVQFNDGSGWQTLPAIDMNSVPFALQAMSAQKLDTYSASDFLRPATLPTCNPATHALTFNGASFTCVALASTTGTVTQVTASGTYLSVATSSTTPVISVNVGTTAGTLAAGNDSRIAGAMQGANNLSELTNAATARTNLGLGTAAVLSVGTASGQIPILNAAGKIASSAIPGTVMQTSDAAGGDLTGSYPGPTVATVGTKTASQVASTVDLVAAATSSNTSGQIVKRDSSGNFTAGSITATSFSGTNIVGRNLQLNDSGNNAITIQTINSGVTPYTIVLPASVGASDQVVGWNAAANAWEYKTISAGSGVTINHSAGGIQINATGTGGTVINVSSTNGYISVATSSTTPALTANVGTTSGTLAAGNDSRFTDARIPTGAAGGDLSGSFPNPILTNTGVTSGANYTKVTVDSKGRVTAAGSINSSDILSALPFIPLSNSLNSGLIFVGNGSNVATAVQLSGDAAIDNAGILTLANSGVAAGSNYTKFNVDSKGRVTSAGSLTSADIMATGFSSSQWVTSGADVSYNTGNVGIGTSNSAYKLDVSGDVNITGTFRVNGTAISTGGGIVMSVAATGGTPITIAGTGSNPTVGIAQATTSAAGYLSSNDWNTFNSKLSAITSSALNSGLMWLGNGSNQAAAVAMSGDGRLDNAGNLTLQNAAVTRGNLGLGTAAVYNVNIVGNASSTEVVYGNDTRLQDARAPIGAAGGDLSGTYPNPILANSGVTSGTDYTKVTVDSKGRVTAAGNITSADITALGFTTSNNIQSTQWATSGADISYVAGNVGIGTSNPTTAFNVGAGTSKMWVETNPGNGPILGAQTTSYSKTNLDNTYWGYLLGLYTPDSTGFQNGISFSNISSGGPFASIVAEDTLGGDYNYGALHFRTRSGGNLTTRLYISDAGNVGIGTTSAAYKLDVSGDVNVAGSFRVNGVAISTGGGSGTVTQVTGSGPISVATSTTTPSISIAQATSSADGYLTQSDWATFNSKLSAITSSALNSGLMWLGNGSNQAAAVAMSGDGRLDNAGNLTLQNAAATRGNLGLGTAAVYNVNIVGNASSTEVVYGNDTRLQDARAPIGAAGGDLSGTYPNPILANSGVTSGNNYSKFNVDSKGRVTVASNLTSADIVALGFVTSNNAQSSQWTTSGTTINYMAGDVGIGTTNPVNRLDVPGANTTNSLSRIGELEFSTYAAGNSFLSANMYFNGSNWVRRSASYGGLFYFYMDEGQFSFFDTGSAGSNAGTQAPQLKISRSGEFGVGPALDWNRGSFTGANFYVGSTGNVGIGTTSPVASAKLTVSGAINTNGSSVIVGNTAGNARSGTVVDIQTARTATQIASGLYSVAIGANNTADNQAGFNSMVAIGYNNIATSGFGTATAIGSGNTANGSGSVAIGSNNNVNGGDATIAIGIDNSVTNHQGTAIGRANTAGRYSAAYGYNNIASYQFGGAFGYANVISADNSYVVGMNVTNTIASSVQIGTSDTAKATILSNGNFGIGTTTAAYKLDVSGDVNVTGSFKINGANINSGTVAQVTGSGPISVATSTTTPVVSISQATSSADGYLTQTDWTTFNSKISAITSSALNSGFMWLGNGSNQAAAVAMSGDGRFDSTGNLTLQNAAITRGNLGLGLAAIYNINLVGNASSTEVVFGTDTRLQDSRAPAGAAGGDLSGTYPNPILANTAVVAGSNYTKFNVDEKGRVISAGALSSGDISGALGYVPANAAAVSQWTTSGSAISYVAGNVGIGTTTVTYPLTVAGDTVGIGSGIARMTAANIVNVGIGNTINYNNSIGLGRGNNTGMGDTAVAIGYNNNAASDVATALGSSNTAGYFGTAIGRANTATGSSSVVIGRNNTASSTDSVAIGIGVNNAIASSLQIGPSDSAKATILSNGNVGIGTTSPNALFTVKTAANATVTRVENSSDNSVVSTGVENLGSGFLTVNDPAGGAKVTLRTDTALSPFIYTDGSGSTIPDGTGNFFGATIGIGISSTVGNENGIIFANNGSSVGAAITSYTASSMLFGIQGLKFKTSDGTGTVTRMTIDQTGNVGVGTSTPTARVHVVGTNTTGAIPNVMTVVGGNSTNGNSGGGISLTGGDGGIGGSLNFTGGAGNDGGDINLTGGLGAPSAGPGVLLLQGGRYGGPGGSASLAAGNGSNGAGGGTLTLKGGLATSGNPGGSIVIGGGVYAAGNGNDVTILPGAKSGANNDGNVLLATTLGNVGIATASPTQKLEVTGNIKVNGQVAAKSQTISGGTSSIDWNNGNSILTDYDCGSNLSFANLQDGGTYTLVVTGTGTTQCSFSTTTTGTDAATVTYRFKPANAARTASSYTLYTLIRVGTTVLVSWSSGF